MGKHLDTLHHDAQEDSDKWRDEQDRSEWFEYQAERYAALADRLEIRLSLAEIVLRNT